MAHEPQFGRWSGRILRALAVSMIAIGAGFIALAASQGVPALTFETLLPYGTGILFILAGILAARTSSHPALILMVLDLVGLVVAGYLASVELADKVPYCGVLKGCEQVALSEYSRIADIPVAVFGVALSLMLLGLAFAWWRHGGNLLLGAHYALSLVGTIFEVRFIGLQIFAIGAVCIWCAAYGISLVLRFVVALIVWLNRERTDQDYEEDPALD